MSKNDDIRRELGSNYGRIVKPSNKDMSAQAIYERINPDEAVREMKEEGGHTIDPRTGERVGRGIAVAAGGYEERHRTETYGKQHLANYLNSPNVLSALTGTNHKIGGWDEKGLAYLDVSRVFSDTSTGRRSARGFAKREAQEAIFDLKTYTTEYNPHHPTNIATGHKLAEGEGEKWRLSDAKVGSTKEPVVERQSDGQQGWMFAETIKRPDKYPTNEHRDPTMFMRY